MESLFEKLKAAKAASDSRPDPEIVDKLRAIGDRREVNPPKPEAPNEPCVHCGVGQSPDTLAEHQERCRLKPDETKVLETFTCPNCGLVFPVGSHQYCQAAPEQKKEPKPKTEPCPYCGKEFRHLAKHKCKEAPVAEAGYMEQGKQALKDATNAEIQERARLLAEQKNKERREFEITSVSLVKEGGHPIERIEPAPESIPPAAVDEAEKEQEAMHQPVGLGNGDGHIQDEPLVAAYDLVLDAVFERNGDVDLEYFSDIIGPLVLAVAHENQVEYWSVVDYGRGPGLLAAKLEKWIQSMKPMGVILADSSTPELRACKEVLKRYARNVIVGVR